MNRQKFFSLSSVVAIVLLMTACSSNVPLEISEEIADAPDFSQIQHQAEALKGQTLRWGGTILSTENKQDTSWVTIVAFPLSNSGRPLASDRSPGRFIAVVDEFLEPLVYKKDREITVRGKLDGLQTIKVGEYPYQYPVLRVDSYHLWTPIPERIEVDPPFYWPYHPYYPVPYYNPRLNY